MPNVTNQETFEKKLLKILQKISVVKELMETPHLSSISAYTSFY